MQYHTGECAVCVCEHARERLEATGALPGVDHPQPGDVQEERDDADGDGGGRTAVSRMLAYAFISCLRLGKGERAWTNVYDSKKVLRLVRRNGQSYRM